MGEAMMNYRCKNCQWWDSKHQSVGLIQAYQGKSVMGICRKHKPGAIRVGDVFYGVQPVMDADEFCGEFRGDA